MVGVPGRSKGCITCRKRKKGCDKKIPFCGQCVALNISCGGYEKPPIWLNSEGSTQTYYTKSPQRSNFAVKSTLKQSGASAITLHDSLTRTARTQKFTGLFWMDYLSGGNGFSLKASGTTSLQRMRLYENLSQVEPALQYVTIALSTATLGANSNDIQLKQKSQQAYGLALHQMAISLDSCKQDKDGMLAAIQLMRVYEQLFGTTFISDPTQSTAQGFRKHIDGETALILSRGPEDAWSPMGRQLLADGRLTQINAYMSRRKRSPFSQRKWKQSRLWHSVTDSPLNKLVDILVEVPGLLEDLDFLRENSCQADAKHSFMDCASQKIATSYAYRIAHAMHLLFHPPAGDYSSVAVFFPLGNAIRYLIMTETYGGQSTMSNERLLLKKIFARPFLGSFVGRFLQSLQADDGVDYGYPAERLVGMVGVEYRARVWWCGMRRAGLPEMPLEGACP
ncbi:hypothetical protein FLONG3_6430 [Fusarium longipes]|uniref:Zn(2)-C6 fungal-type domain-containing protein n=1 Tax=Fusarium longipes TaxID=694270 RepID=A0A395SL17_9HYPO|nr:hypothetical protein FLONG3_6430 [Fusarium longipes]